MSCFFEIVLANEILYRADVIGQLLREGERLPNETRAPLSQCAVESLDVIGDAAVLFDHLMLPLWNHTRIRLPAICIERRMGPVPLWY